MFIGFLIDQPIDQITDFSFALIRAMHPLGEVQYRLLMALVLKTRLFLAYNCIAYSDFRWQIKLPSIYQHNL